MPHKFKQPREQQRHSRLPHVKEEAEAEDETSHTGGDAQPAHISLLAAGTRTEKTGSLEAIAMEGKYAKIETSPLPLQRALLSSVVNRKCGPSTPVPSWKMYDISFQGSMDTASSDANPSSLMRGMDVKQGRVPRNTVSARKLAASLWEMQGSLNSSRHHGKGELKAQHQVGLVNSEHHHKDRDAAADSHRIHPFEGEVGTSKQPKVIKSLPKESKPSGTGSPSPPEVSRSMAEDAAQSRGEDGSTLSCELMKVLNQIWALEEQHNRSTALVASLRTELKKTRSSIKELQMEQSSYKEDLKLLNNKLADEKNMLQDRAEEAAFAAVKPFKEDLEIERTSKVKLEVKHKKLAKEIDDTRKTLAKAMQEFEREKKARELMEDVCDELAREIGEDKAQVEELKRQSAKYREEVEQERRMLQMAEVWREERVHMKLAEARFELEEKNAALDKLRSELEAFLRAKRSLDEGNNGDVSKLVSNSEQAAISALNVGDRLIQGGQKPMKKEVPTSDVFLDEKSRHGVGELDFEDSLDDDLHSIELNRISNSGSHEGPLSTQGISMNPKAPANGKPSANDLALFPQSANGAINSKQGEMSNLSLDRITSGSSKAMISGSSTSEIQEAESQFSRRGPERDTKDWDLGKGRAAWSGEALPRFYHESTKHGVGLNVKGRSGFGQMGSLSRSGSKGETAGATDRANSKLEIFELRHEHSLEAQDDGGLLSIGRHEATFPSSPTRKWTHTWSSSHDPAESSKASQPFKDSSQGFKDNSLKARLLEAKLESQQAKARNSKAAPVS